MSETSGLFAALAKLQAELPKVGKNATAQYGKYADLADVSAVVLPLLGKYGLAFTARPTMHEGSFVLAYSLVHVSGEREDGFYPLPANGNSQQLGSAITYARRYSLCAVTGVAPDEDDDGAAAVSAPWQGRQAAGDAWDDAKPAPRQNGNGKPQGQVTRPAGAVKPAAAPAEADEAVIADWASKIDEITSADDADRCDGELRQIFQSKRMNSATANAIRRAIHAKRAALAERASSSAKAS